MNLGGLLARHRNAIAARWASRVRSLPGNHYRDWSAEEIVAWAAGALDAIVESVQTGSPRPLEAHATTMSQRRAEQHFEIDQVIEGVLLLYEETLPYVLGPSAEAPDDPLRAARDLHACLRQMAAHFAVIFARTMHEQREHVAVLEERNRLARDLHDSASQSLYGLGMYAEAAARLLESGQAEAAADHLRAVRDSASDALREMRFLIFELRPPVLREEGLVGALRARLAAVENRAGVRAELTTDAGGRLPDEIEEALYGIAREALNNGLRHGRATCVRVVITGGAGGVTLDVRDNGLGFDVAAAPGRGGLGLQGMRERAASIGACLHVASRPGAGTQVTVTVPAKG